MGTHPNFAIQSGENAEFRLQFSRFSLLIGLFRLNSAFFDLF